MTQFFHDTRLGPDLLWRDFRVAPFARPVPALFLDRDGVLIEEKNYVSDPKDVCILPGIPELIRGARNLGLAVVVITNQAGIGRGYFGWAEFMEVEKRISQLLDERATRVDAVLACPFHRDATGPYRRENHPWRKPNPGMLLEAARALNLDLGLSLMVGDKASDQQAALSAGLHCGVHVLTGYGQEQQDLSRQVSTPAFTVHVVEQPQHALAFLPSRAKVALSK